MQLQQLKSQISKRRARGGTFSSTAGINTNIVNLFEESGLPHLLQNFIATNANSVIQSIEGIGVGQAKRASDKRDIKPDTELKITFTIPGINGNPPQVKTKKMYASLKNIASLTAIPKIAQTTYPNFLMEAGLPDSYEMLNAISLSEARQNISDLVYYQRVYTALQGTGEQVLVNGQIADFTDTADMLIEFTPNGIKAYSIQAILFAVKNIMCQNVRQRICEEVPERL